MKKYIQIATFSYPSELAIVKSVLESNEIDCFIKDELTIQTHNFYSNAIGGIRLEVPYDQCKKAVSILIETGHKNFISLDLQKSNEVDDKKQKLNSLLKIVIKLVVTIALLFIVTILILRFFYA